MCIRDRLGGRASSGLTKTDRAVTDLDKAGTPVIGENSRIVADRRLVIHPVKQRNVSRSPVQVLVIRPGAGSKESCLEGACWFPKNSRCQSSKTASEKTSLE